MKLVPLHVCNFQRLQQSPSYDKSVLALEKIHILITSDRFAYLLTTLFMDGHLLRETHRGSISLSAEGPALVNISSTHVQRYS